MTNPEVHSYSKHIHTYSPPACHRFSDHSPLPHNPNDGYCGVNKVSTKPRKLVEAQDSDSFPMTKKIQILSILFLSIFLMAEILHAEEPDDSLLIQEFEYYESKIIEKLATLDSKETIQRRKDAVLQRAKEVYESRFSLNIVGSPGGRKTKIGTLDGNYVSGLIYFNNKQDGTPSPYGELIWANFGNKSVDFKIDGVITGFATIGGIYKQLSNKVIVASKFGQPLLSLPYPFSKHCFKASVESGLSHSIGREVLMMNVPKYNHSVLLNGKQMYEKLKGKTFIGFASTEDIKITISDEKFAPDLFTVLEFSNDGYVSVCFPQLDRVELFEAEFNLTGDGTVLLIKESSSYNLERFKKDYPHLPFDYYDMAAEVFQRNSKGKNIIFATVMNNGEVLKLVNPFEGSMYMVQPQTTKMKK